MAFKMKGFSAFTKKTDEEYVPQSQRKDKEYEPQTKTRGWKGGETADMMPQTEMDKADVGRLEGEIMGIYDNEYHEAKEDGDTSAQKRLEQRMLKLKREIERRGGKDESGVDMSAFKKTEDKTPPSPGDRRTRADGTEEIYMNGNFVKFDIENPAIREFQMDIARDRIAKNKELGLYEE